MKKQSKVKKVATKARVAISHRTGQSNPSSKEVPATNHSVAVHSAYDPGDEPYTFSIIGDDHPYPALDKVAHLAAILLKRDSLRGINAAVRTALSIYDCCYGWYEEKNIEMASSRITFSDDDHLLLREFYTFDDAIKAITGQSRPQRAREYFSDFQIFCLTNKGTEKKSKEIDKKLDQLILEMNKSGFSAEEVVRLKRRFQKYFPTRRKKNLTR